MPRVEEKLEALGLQLPPPPGPVAAYVSAVRTGDLVFVSGHGPMRDGQFTDIGKLGRDLDIEAGYQAARLVMLNCLASVKAEIGDLDEITRIVCTHGHPDHTNGNARAAELTGAPVAAFKHSELISPEIGLVNDDELAVGENLLLVNPAWLPSEPFARFDCIAVHPDEPSAANALRIRDQIIYPKMFPRTLDRLERRGLRVSTVDASEVAKAEGAVTCCSLILEDLRILGSEDLKI